MRLTEYRNEIEEKNLKQPQQAQDIHFLTAIQNEASGAVFLKLIFSPLSVVVISDHLFYKVIIKYQLYSK